MWAFIKTRYFWLSLLAMVVILVGLLLIILSSLDWFTNHGISVRVPDVKSYTFDNARKVLDGLGLNYEISDSIFDEKKKPLEVLQQVPAAGSNVKPGRTIYLTVNAIHAPIVKLPDLKDMSLKQALLVLKSLGLKMGDIIYKQDIAKNAILEMQIKGAKVEAGKEIPKGTVIDVVAGNGLDQNDIEVPYLLGKGAEDARTILKDNALDIGTMVLDRSVKHDTDGAFIYKQSPENFEVENNTLKPGETVDIFLTKDTAKLNRAINAHRQRNNERSIEANNHPDK